MMEWPDVEELAYDVEDLSREVRAVKYVLKALLEYLDLPDYLYTSLLERLKEAERP